MNKIFKNYLEDKGFEIIDNGGYSIIDGYEVNIINVNDNVNPIIVHISAFLDEQEKNYFLEKVNNGNLKRVNIQFDLSGVIVKLNDFTFKKLIDKLDDTINLLINYLQEINALGNGICPICAKELTDENKETTFVNGFKITIDKRMYQEINFRIQEEKEAFEKAPNNILYGTLGALIGGLVGAALTYIIYNLGYVASLSAIVATILGCFLYKKFGGKPTKIMYVIVSLFSFVLIELTIFIIYYLACKDVNVEFSEAMKIEEFAAGLMQDLLMNFVFTAIGIACVIGSEIKKNRQ